MVPKQGKKSFRKVNLKLVFSVLIISMFIAGSAWGFQKAWQQITRLRSDRDKINQELSQRNEAAKAMEASLQGEIDKLNKEDLRATNKQVKTEIDKLKEAYKNALLLYKQLLEIREISNKTSVFDSAFASILDGLSKDKIDLVATQSAKLKADMDKETTRLASVVKIPENIVEKNTPPSSGFSRQKVVVNNNSYLVDIIAGDLNTTKVIVDSASDATCTNDCPVLPLATYVSRSGAYAGINGTYFCPDTYPDCASKKNTFDVLLMNKNKVYFNSENNIYSTVPVAVFSGTSARFIRESKDWGRDTGVDAVIANRPLLVLDGNAMFSGTGEPKEGLKGNRSFLGSSGSMAYIGIVHGATVAETATVLQFMGIKNAINLDSGGSSALWNGGYKAGPGRNLPNAVLFVRK